MRHQIENQTLPDIAVIIPCYNEAVTINHVVTQFYSFIPDATVYVFDNNSKDDTVLQAIKSGAKVHKVIKQGKGNVVRQMFSDINADVYILIDGDDTYDVSAAPSMIKYLLDNQLDMVIGTRISTDHHAYRFGHSFGNKLFNKTFAWIFGNSVSDLLSGYRVFSKRFVKSFPALSEGFEIETELTVHALQLQMPIAEIPTQYKARPEGSISKLNTYHDGFRILTAILKLTKAEHPLAFFGTIFIILASTSVILGYPLINTWLETGLVPRFPTAILASALMISAFLSLATGLVLDIVTLGRKEFKRLFYLSVPFK